MKILITATTSLCGLSLIILIYGILNNWGIPTETILAWGGAYLLCPVMAIMVLVK